MQWQQELKSNSQRKEKHPPLWGGSGLNYFKEAWEVSLYWHLFACVYAQEIYVAWMRAWMNDENWVLLGKLYISSNIPAPSQAACIFSDYVRRRLSQEKGVILNPLQHRLLLHLLTACRNRWFSISTWIPQVAA